MRKYIPLLLACLLLLTGCGRNEVDPELVITCAPREEDPVIMTQAAQESQSPAPAVQDIVFTANGVDLVPGNPFDPSMLPTPKSVYEVPSCAIEGTDNLYNYGTFELTVFDDGNGEVIYSILLLDPNIATNEGLALGDGEAAVTEIYGTGYIQEGTARVYPLSTGSLYIILQNDSVVSIEYRMITE